VCNDGNSCTNFDSCGLTASQNFDQAPNFAIPAPWTTSVTGALGDQPWTVASSSSDSAPLSALANDPDHVTDKFLVSPPIAIHANAQQAVVGFFQRYDLEPGYDGGVLEISINNGAFTDILAAGGSFVFGGYNGTISAAYGSPIAGRSAWTSTSAGYPSY